MVALPPAAVRLRQDVAINLEALMKNRIAFVVSLLALAILGSVVQAQQPPAGGGRGAAPDPNPLSVVQQVALSREMAIPTALTAAQTAAASALVRASLTLPANTTDIATKAQALAEAELALANARATAFERAQKSLQPLNSAQIATYSRNAAGGGGGRGGAGPNWETAYYDHTGFIALFDGKTLNGWEGEEGEMGCPGRRHPPSPDD